ncbi:MAG: hypothetical protein AB7I34_05050 [Rhizobiaceae bacterium]
MSYLDLDQVPAELLDRKRVVVLWADMSDPATNAMRVLDHGAGIYGIETRAASCDRAAWSDKGGRLYMSLRTLTWAVQIKAAQLFGPERGRQCVKELVETIKERKVWQSAKQS